MVNIVLLTHLKIISFLLYGTYCMKRKIVIQHLFQCSYVIYILFFQIKDELSRRKSFHKDSHERHEFILKKYSKLHPHLWHLDPRYIDRNFGQVVKICEENGSIQNLYNAIKNNGGYVYGTSFRILFSSYTDLFHT